MTKLKTIVNFFTTPLKGLYTLKQSELDSDKRVLVQSQEQSKVYLANISDIGGGSPAGSDTQIQYNNAGAFGADSGFTRDGATGNTNISATYGGTDTYSYTLDNNLFGDGTVGLLQQYSSTDGSSGYAGIIKEGTDLGFLVNIDTGAGNSFEIFGYPGEAGFIVDGSGFTLRDEQCLLVLSHTTQSAVTFTGSGLDDLTPSGIFSGTVPTTYTVTIDGVNEEFLQVDTSTISGGSFAVSDTVTNGTGGSADIVSISVIGDNTYLRVTINSGSFASADVIDNGSGVTGTLNSNQTTYDTITYTDGVVTETNVPTFTEPTYFVNGILFIFGATTGHTLTNEWTWDYTSVNQNVLDFSNNDYKFQSVLGTDTFGYQISDNLLGFGITGSASTYTNVAGDLGLTGLLKQGDDIKVGNTIQLSTGETGDMQITAGGIDLSVYDGASYETQLNINSTEFSLTTSLSVTEYGISQSAGAVTVGNLSSGNNTKITIDDVNEQITISNLPAYDDDTAAGVGGLTVGMVYMTTGSGSAPLNAAGILMIKQ